MLCRQKQYIVDLQKHPPLALSILPLSPAQSLLARTMHKLVAPTAAAALPSGREVVRSGETWRILLRLHRGTVDGSCTADGDGYCAGRTSSFV